MQNYRKNGYTAYFTSTFISADLVTPSLKKRLGVFVRRGKLPMWSFDEVVEPTMNQPLSLAVKEFATKLANALYGYRAPDATVRELLARIERGRDDATYLDVYQLGFTNNPLAVETLAKLARDDSEYVRIAAISSLGTLRATSQLALLRGLHADRDVLWQERAMALKSIGDLDVPEGNAFLRSEQDRLAPQNDTGSLWWKQVLALYL
jgi:hypothetical protein